MERTTYSPVTAGEVERQPAGGGPSSRDSKPDLRVVRRHASVEHMLVHMHDPEALMCRTKP